jgi:preprotein translocase subunit SecA
MAGRGTDIVLVGNWEVGVANLQDATPRADRPDPRPIGSSVTNR